MFQLVVSVVSIALTSALALASLHYGGSILSGATVRASVAALINDGQQIGGAVVLAALDDPYQPMTIDRIPSVPLPPRVAAAGARWQLDPAGLAYIRLDPAASEKVCNEVHGMGGLDDAVSWADAPAAAAALKTAGAPFGCVGNGTDHYFAYRVG
jgi:hypothetical protein